MKTIKVLLVEDESILAKIIKEALEKRAIEVLVVPDGEVGLKTFYEYRPDIVVADIMMPKLDGFSMVKILRQNDKKTPILFLSAKSDVSDVVQGFEIGGNDYLKKPFSMEELIVRIKALLNRINDNPPAVQKAVYQIGDYTFDSLSQKLTHPQQEYLLSHREAEILRNLCANMNNVIENKPILLELWGDDNFFNTRSLHVFIVKIRKKLALDPRIQILNIRSVGYKLVCNKVI